VSNLAVTLTVEELRALIVDAAKEAAALVQSSPDREVMTLSQCAEFLGRHTKVVTQLVREQELPAHYISEREPRFLRSEVIAWLHRQPKTAKSEIEAA
jgi:predicted DNA-binding transcriptional regulator AlpA